MSNKIRALLLMCLLAALSSAHSASSSPLAPRIMPLKFSCDDYALATADATDPPFSAAKDGMTDCTAAIQAAADAVGAAGGGVVFLPAGRYLMTGSVTLPVGVTLRGDWKAPDRASGDFRVDGTILMATGSRGEPNAAPLISIECGGCVRNLSIWYPDQTPSDIAPYPWTIASDCSKGQDSFTVENVTLVNSYQGIRFGQTVTELGMVRNVYGTPLTAGISIDFTSDTARIAGVCFGPEYWLQCGLGNKPDEIALKNLLISRATAIELLRTDGQCLYDVNIEGYQIGIHFGASERGCSYGPAYGLIISGCDTGLLIDEALPLTGWQFASCSVDALWSAVSLGPKFEATVQFNGCHLSALGEFAVHSEGGGLVQMQNCVLTGSAIMKNLGSLSMVACRFDREDSNIVLGPLVSRALIAGSAAASMVEPRGNGDVQVDPAPVLSTSIDNAPPFALPPDPRPARPLVMNVVDYGAQAGAYADNTGAFQKALDAAGAAGGGTVYAPPGEYRFAGSLTVPTGVELRGSFDAPHHTMSAGTVLMPAGNRGRDDGTPFLSLSSGSGVRGLTIYYPEQKVDDIAAYPWTIRAMGPRCWLLDVTGSNAYRLADFGTYPSEGYLIRDVDGGPLRVGIWVSKGSGEVDNCQFNNHFWMRRYSTAPPLSTTITDTGKLGKMLHTYLSKNLEGFVFGDCPNVLQVDNVVIPDAHGLRFVSDAGRASSGWVIGHQSDLSAVGLRVDAAGAGGLKFVNTQLVNVVPDGPARALEVGPDCSNDTIFFNGLTWGNSIDRVVSLLGSGHATLESWSFQQGGVEVGRGDFALQGVMCRPGSGADVSVSSRVKSLEVDACLTSNDRFTVDKKSSLQMRDCAQPIPPILLQDRFASGFESGDPAPDLRVETNLLGAGALTCAVVPGSGRSGSTGVQLNAKLPNGVEHSAAVIHLFDAGGLMVKPDTIFRYWIKPSTLISRYSCVDLVFADGHTLRASHSADMSGGSLHPATTRGIVGQWTMIQTQLGSIAAGKSISEIVLILDDYHGDVGPASVAIDDIEIGEPKMSSGRAE